MQLLRPALALVLTAAFGATVPSAKGSEWPRRPVHIIVPAPAGGAYDRMIRPVARDVAEQLKRPFIVENKPGAGNLIGTQAGAAATPDGYTLTLTGMVNTISHSLYEKVPFDIVRDFKHVATIAGSAQWLVVNGREDVNSLRDLLAKAEREPGVIAYASSGQGSTGHLLMELLQRATSTKFTHVPYKGGAPALQDVLSGQVRVTVIPPSGAMAHIRSGRLKVLAVSSATRSSELPNVPTFSELGFGQLTLTSWIGISAPKGTPDEIVAKLSAAVRASLVKPEVRAALEAEGGTPLIMSTEDFDQLVKADTARWGTLIRTLKLKAD